MIDLLNKDQLCFFDIYNKQQRKNILLLLLRQKYKKKSNSTTTFVLLHATFTFPGLLNSGLLLQQKYLKNIIR